MREDGIISLQDVEMLKWIFHISLENSQRTMFCGETKMIPLNNKNALMRGTPK